MKNDCESPQALISRLFSFNFFLTSCIFKSIASLNTLATVICVRIFIENSIISCAWASCEIKVSGPITQPIFVVFPKTLDNEPTYNTLSGSIVRIGRTSSWFRNERSVNTSSSIIGSRYCRHNSTSFSRRFWLITFPVGFWKFGLISTAFNLFLWIDSFSFSKSIPSSSIGIPNKRVPEALKRGNR